MQNVPALLANIVAIIFSAATIQQLKHSVPKGDKKKKKQVMTEIAVLQAKMEEKHKSEIEDFDKSKVIKICQVIQFVVEFYESMQLRHMFLLKLAVFGLRDQKVCLLMNHFYFMLELWFW